MAVTDNDEKKKSDISNIMETFGKYQIIQYFWISLLSIFVAMIGVNYVFVVGDVDYRCRIDECEDVNSTAQFPSWWPDANIDRCSAPVLRSREEFCSNDSFTGGLTSCDHWIYESNNTVVAELDLACDPWKVNVIGASHSLGMLLSMPIAGWISDKIGRKPTLIFCTVGGVVGIFKTLVSSYNMFLFIEILEAFLTGGQLGPCMILLLEIVGIRYRILSGIIWSYSSYIGECLLVCLAIFVPNWKTLIYIIYGPSISFIFCTFLIKESPRWQIVKGKTENAKKIMKKIADINKIRINSEELANIDEVKLKKEFNLGCNEVKEGLMNAFKSKEVMTRLFVAGVCRFSSSFVYYGMMINSVWLPGDKHINYLVSALMSFPGEILSLYLMNKVGRKIPLIVGFLICGGMCIISAFIPVGYEWAKLTFFCIGKVIIAACFTGAITYSLELFPTSVRGSLLGVTALCARIGGILAPLTPILNTTSEVLPFLFFGCCAIVSGLVTCLTPETKDLPLFDTIKQVENSCNKHKIDLERAQNVRYRPNTENIEGKA